MQPTIDILRVVFLVLHFVGIASLLGSFMVEIKDIIKGKGKVLAGMFHGSLTMLVSGLLLVGLAEMGEGDVNHMKVGIKLAIVVIITVLVIIYRKKDVAPSWVLWTIGVLTLANIVIAIVLPGFTSAEALAAVSTVGVAA